MKQKDMLRSVLRSPLSRACSSEIFCRKRIQNCRFVQLHTRQCATGPFAHGEGNAHGKKRSRTWSFPKGGVVVVELLELAQMRVAVVDQLLKCAISHAAHRLPVSAREMAHRSPAVHLIAVASGDGSRKQRCKSKVLHGGENDLVRRSKK
jgi:hypothetical protein